LPILSSRVKSPRSTHWRAQIVVISFVHDAIQKVLSAVMGFAADSSRLVTPTAFL